MLALYEEYIKMRESIKSPLTELGLTKLVARCDRLSNSNVRVQKIILETAIINNWKNVYLPRESELEHLADTHKNEMRYFLGLE